ncbi:xanthine dehydrogenase family protein molybdopterin-binding subunit [Glacieibacterium megasporae]|uniref:xanthine dehydrogenase family protein molybdopterin-binding subunit n=1 Tax=Glacieibacterium megasporae TaxID=2835787 RepID=UPI001C1E4015|nr:xanthine dehydrogenase family protein molybdopterin-binding subunit [Polymorphobacter megasporae]UAJ10561.1 xanthine dehydrogenase family protein molybdopterin-binding subunit [Polymorphobacter megasporae]
MFEKLLGEHHNAFTPQSVGKPVPRVDGRAKVTGQARFTAEHRLEGLVHGVVIGSAIARGRIALVDTREAAALPGVIAVVTPATAPRLAPLPDKVQGIQYSGEGGLIEMLLPMQDDAIHYAGQAIVMVVAESLEEATYAASRVTITYDEETPRLDLDLATRRSKPDSYCGMEPLQLSTGNPAKAFDEAEVQLECQYKTPVHTHSAIETLATVAAWEKHDGRNLLTLYDTTRVIKTANTVLAHCLDMPEADIRLVVKFLGGSFGSKAWMFGNVLLVASCARMISRPLKVEWSRQQMFELNGYRPETRQTIRMGATRGGKLISLRHDAVTPTSMVSGYPEPVTGMTMMMYEVPNLAISQEIRHLDLPTPSPLRGVGVLAGGWALETAMDELAHELDLDPIELRMRNDAKKGPMSGHPFTAKHLDRCLRRGQELIGWERRRPPGEGRKGRWAPGLGVASSTLPAVLDQASAHATLFADGTVEVLSATHEIGNGAYTVFSQIAADALALPIEAVRFDLGDSAFPSSPITAGSRTTASVGAAVLDAGCKLIDALKDLARHSNDGPLFGAGTHDIVAADGRLTLLTDPGVGETYGFILRRSFKDKLEADGVFTPTSKSKFAVSALTEQYEMHSFGAVFAQIRVDLDTGVIRVPRLVGVYDVGRVINPRTTASQLRGAMIAGLGGTLTEEGFFDPNNGRAVIRNLADYHIPTCADVPEITVETLDIPDPHMGALGARGLGELGTNNVPAAIGNALFNATGKRLRSLPLTPDRVMEALR